MFKKITIRTKLLAAFLAVGIIPFSVVGGISLFRFTDALSEQSFSKLEGVRDLKKAQIQNFLDERRKDMSILMETVANLRQAAFEKLRTVQTIKKAQIEEYFQTCLSDVTVLSQNASVADALIAFANTFDAEGSFDEYRHKTIEDIRHGRSLKQFKKGYGYDDMLLITLGGDIVYSTNRESDFSQNLLTGDLKDTTLYESFQNGLTGLYITDFAPYSPAGGQYVAFVSAPISRYGTLIGVVVLKLSKDVINAIAQRNEGMGESGETYFVGQLDDNISYRNDRSVKKGKIGDPKSGKDIRLALSGKSGSMVKTGHTGGMEISSYGPVNVLGLDWAIITTMNLKEVIAPKLIGEDEDFFSKYIREHAYYDLMLIHPDGNVFYSVDPGTDYETNVIHGDYKDSGLGKLVRKVLNSKSFGFADIQPYAPSGGKPAAFMAQPVVFSEEVELIVALQLPIDVINDVMQERSGMGETGETYLVGLDKLMRSDSYRDSQNYSVEAVFANKEERQINTLASREALSGVTGRAIIINYNGKQVLSAYTPLKVWYTQWALIAEIEASEALGGMRTLRKLMGLTAVIAIGGIIFVALLFTRYIIQPVNRVADRVRDIAKGEGNLTSRLEVRNKDELGELARWFNIFIENIQGMVGDIARSAKTLAVSSSSFLEIASHMTSGADQMSEISDSASTATEEMSMNISTMASAAEEMSVNIQSISSTAGQMSRSMNAVASAIEEMSAAINNIAGNAQEGAEISAEAMTMADTATSTMKSLGEAAKGIGDVTKIIRRIAEQTNLLALNATIEAASAGEAGRGFAVVGSEIKELAGQSAQAAADIARRIDGIQKKTRGAVAVIADISGIISKISASTAVTTNAVDQQTRTVNDISANAKEINIGTDRIASSIAEVARGADDMSQNAGEAAKGAHEMSSNIQGISQSAKNSNIEAKQVSTLVEDLVRITGELQNMVSRFKIE